MHSKLSDAIKTGMIRFERITSWPKPDGLPNSPTFQYH